MKLAVDAENALAGKKFAHNFSRQNQPTRSREEDIFAS
jgi:hypothetical protein